MTSWFRCWLLGFAAAACVTAGVVVGTALAVLVVGTAALRAFLVQSSAAQAVSRE